MIEPEQGNPGGRPDGYHFRPLAVDAGLPEAWRALDRAVARWVVIHGGSPLLARVAGWASLAEGHGDSALPLTGSDDARHGMPALDEEALALLRSDPMVECTGGAPRADAPFVIGHGHFYLRRNFRHEVAVAGGLMARRGNPLPTGELPAADLDALFHGADADAGAQREAVARVAGRRLFVLTGGPGTGKTSTVLRMLLMLQRDALRRGVPAPVMRLAAPTGKAAQRLSAALREGAAALLADSVLSDAWQACVQAALAAEAGTLHRLLGSRGPGGGFRHGPDNPVPADVVVVDEASMVDLALLRVLLDALRPDTTLILVGDADQLTSVGTGSVLLDLVGALEADAAPELVRLRHSFRAEQELVRINEAILAGDGAGFARACRDAGPRVLRRDVAAPADLRHALAAWSHGLQALLRAGGALDRLPAGRDDLVLAALEALRRRQLLCALRDGGFGAVAANAAIEHALRGRGLDQRGATWYPGRAVMVTRNDAMAGLWNGDVGICLQGADGRLRVWFEVAAGAGATRAVRAFDPGNLPEHQGAFAATIHKSQGSEYDHVALLLPPDADSRILSRQLLYTGASRARHTLELWCTDGPLAAALATPILRAGGLRQRLAMAPATAR